MQHISDQTVLVSLSFSSKSELLSIVLEDCQAAWMTSVYASTLTWEDGDILVNTGNTYSMGRK